MPKDIPTPSVIRFQRDNGFNPDTSWLSNVRQYLKNDMNSTDPNIHDDTLSKILTRRLWIHLEKYKGTRGMEPTASHWEFMFTNMSRMAVILKLRGTLLDHSRLPKAGYESTLFSPRYVLNHELIQEHDAIYHGCYLVFDSKTGKFIRAGSASNKLGHQDAVRERKGRINEHIQASKKPYLSNSIFYNSYPDRHAEKIIEGLRRGYFDELEFVPVLFFSDENKEEVQSLFQWNNELIERFKKTNIGSFFYSLSLYIFFVFYLWFIPPHLGSSLERT